MLKTCCINFVFLAAVVSYAARRDIRRVLLLLVLAALLFVIHVAANSDPVSANSRFGWDVGINPNQAGMATAFACGICVALSTQKPARRLRLLWLLPAVAFFGVTLLTGSLKAVIVLCGILWLYLLLRWPRKWWVLPLIAAVVLAALFALYKSNLMEEEEFFYVGFFHDIIWHRLESVFLYLEKGETWALGTAVERAGLLQTGWNAFVSRPLTGFGLDCFQHLTDAAGKATGTYSHNNYLELLVSGGIPMLLLFDAPLVLLLVRGVRRMNGRTEIMLLVTLLAAVLLADFAVVSYYDRALLLVPALLCGAVWQKKEVRLLRRLPFLEFD